MRGASNRHNLLMLLVVLLGAYEAVSSSQGAKTSPRHTATAAECCGLGKRMAKHGIENCTWSSSLVLKVGIIDSKWRRKSPLTGAEPSKKMVSLRLLRKCRLHKSFYEKCCRAEVRANKLFLRRLYKFLQMVAKKVKKDVDTGKSFVSMDETGLETLALS